MSKPYSHHDPIDDQGKAEPVPKKPNGWTKSFDFLSQASHFFCPARRINRFVKHRPSTSVRRAMKRADRQRRIEDNNRARALNKHLSRVYS